MHEDELEDQFLLKFQDVWVEKHILVCLKIHLHVYEVNTFILEISEEKNVNA